MTEYTGWPGTLGIGVAKLTMPADDPTALEATYYHDGLDDAASPVVRRTVLRGEDDAIRFPGRNRLTVTSADAAHSAITLEVAVKGGGFALNAVSDAAHLGSGLGVIDPDDPRSMLVSWWTGDAQPYGIAKYSIRDARTIIGHYLSKMSPDQPGVDTVTGPTAGGFPGRYSLMTREANGRTWGPHDWRLTARGELIDLSWTENGKVICRGFGLTDPRDPGSIVVTYVAT